MLICLFAGSVSASRHVDALASRRRHPARTHSISRKATPKCKVLCVRNNVNEHENHVTCKKNLCAKKSSNFIKLPPGRSTHIQPENRSGLNPQAMKAVKSTRHPKKRPKRSGIPMLTPPIPMLTPRSMKSYASSLKETRKKEKESKRLRVHLVP